MTLGSICMCVNGKIKGSNITDSKVRWSVCIGMIDNSDMPIFFCPYQGTACKFKTKSYWRFKLPIGVSYYEALELEKPDLPRLAIPRDADLPEKGADIIVTIPDFGELLKGRAKVSSLGHGVENRKVGAAQIKIRDQHGVEYTTDEEGDIQVVEKDEDEDVEHPQAHESDNDDVVVESVETAPCTDKEGVGKHETMPHVDDARITIEAKVEKMGQMSVETMIEAKLMEVFSTQSSYFVDNQTCVFKEFYDDSTKEKGVWKGRVISYNAKYNRWTVKFDQEEKYCEEPDGKRVQLGQHEMQERVVDLLECPRELKIKLPMIKISAQGGKDLCCVDDIVLAGLEAVDEVHVQRGEPETQHEGGANSDPFEAGSHIMSIGEKVVQHNVLWAKSDIPKRAYTMCNEGDTFFNVCIGLGIPQNRARAYYMFLGTQYGPDSPYHVAKKSDKHFGIRFCNPWGGRGNSKSRVQTRFTEGTVFIRPTGERWRSILDYLDRDSNMKNEEYLNTQLCNAAFMEEAIKARRGTPKHEGEHGSEPYVDS